MTNLANISFYKSFSFLERLFCVTETLFLDDKIVTEEPLKTPAETNFTRGVISLKEFYVAALCLPVKIN